MTDTSTNLALPYLAAAQAQKHVTINEAFLRLDALVQGAAVSRTVSAEPASPADGQVFILPSGKTGTNWGTMANGVIAYYRDGVWEQIQPREGWTLYVKDEDQHVVWSGAAWGPILSAGQTSGFRNRLLNAAFTINQRAVASNADDTYCFDRWYILTQTGAVAVSALTDPEVGRPTGLRITQSQASAQRFGIAQIVESANIRDLRSVAAAMAARIRCSSSQAIRMAILEHIGTADMVTSDVVNSWTSTTYTASNFFVAGLNVIAIGASTPAANTWTDLPQITGSFGSGLTNAIVFVWTEGTAAQNVTLDLDQVQLEAGAYCGAFARRSLGDELDLCQRYLVALGGATPTDPIGLGLLTSTTDLTAFVGYKPMRITPTYSVTAASDFNVASIMGNAAASATSVGSICKTGAQLSFTCSGQTAGQAGFLKANTTAARLFFDAEL